VVQIRPDVTTEQGSERSAQTKACAVRDTPSSIRKEAHVVRITLRSRKLYKDSVRLSSSEDVCNI